MEQHTGHKIYSALTGESAEIQISSILTIIGSGSHSSSILISTFCSFLSLSYIQNIMILQEQILSMFKFQQQQDSKKSPAPKLSSSKQFVETYELKLAHIGKMYRICVDNCTTPYFQSSAVSIMLCFGLPILTNIYYTFRRGSVLNNVMPFAMFTGCGMQFVYFLRKDFENFCLSEESQAEEARKYYKEYYGISRPEPIADSFMEKLQKFEKERSKRIKVSPNQLQVQRDIKNQIDKSLQNIPFSPQEQSKLIPFSLHSKEQSVEQSKLIPKEQSDEQSKLTPLPLPSKEQSDEQSKLTPLPLPSKEQSDEQSKLTPLPLPSKEQSDEQMAPIDSLKEDKKTARAGRRMDYRKYDDFSEDQPDCIYFGKNAPKEW